MSEYIESHGKLNEYHLNRIKQTIAKALVSHSRIFAIRVDLHVPCTTNLDGMIDPYDFAKIDAAVITRFIASLKAKIKSDLKAKANAHKRVHPTTLRYIWTRELSPTTSNTHYHVLLLLNQDTYAFLGDYKKSTGNLSAMIKDAWYSALGITIDEDISTASLIYFPDNPCYYLSETSQNFKDTYDDLVYRVSYFAKEETKNKDDGQRNFGYSQG